MEIKTLPMLPDKYENKAIRFYDKGTHCELIFTDDFNLPSSGQMHDGIEANTLITDIVTDLRRANKDKEIHIFDGAGHAKSIDVDVDRYERVLREFVAKVYDESVEI